MSRFFSWILSIIFIWGFACNRLEKGQVVAWVNGHPIYLSDYQERIRKNWMFKEASAQELEYRLKLRCLEEMIEQELILEEARRLGIQVSDQELEAELKDMIDLEAEDTQKVFQQSGTSVIEWKERIRKELLIRKTIETVLSYQVYISDSEIRDYYERNKAHFFLPKRVRIRQILVSEEGLAQEILAQLRAGADFGELAERYSESPEAKKGGDLGWVEPEQLLLALQEEIGRLLPGQISKLVESSFGYHIIKLEERAEQVQLDFEQAKPEIKKSLEEEQKNQLFNKWLEGLFKKARIRINYQLL